MSKLERESLACVVDAAIFRGRGSISVNKVREAVCGCFVLALDARGGPSPHDPHTIPTRSCGETLNESRSTFLAMRTSESTPACTNVDRPGTRTQQGVTP